MQSISMTIETGQLLDRIASSLLAIFSSAETIVVYLRDAAAGAMSPRKVVTRQDQKQNAAFSLSPGMHEVVVEQGRAVLSAPAGFASAGGSRSAGGGLAMHAP